MIYLDTSFLIRALVPGSAQDSRLREWLVGGETLAMSAVAWAEFLCGPVDSRTEELALDLIIQRTAFSERQASLAARLFNESGRRRGTFIDCMIAAAALDDDSAMAMVNDADFRRFESLGLRLMPTA